jgi:hypothetical protein
VYIIKNVANVGGITIAPSGGDSIDNVAGAQVLLPDQYDVVMLMSDGTTKWWILSFTNL